MTHTATDTPTPPMRPRLDSLDGLPAEPLSQAARARRAALRDELDTAVRARGTRRVALRSAAALVLLVSVAALVVVASRRGAPANPPGTPTIASDHLQPAPAPDESREVAADSPRPRRTTLVGYIANDPTILERCAASPTISRVQMLDDRELLAELRAAGLAAGLIRTETTTRLAFHHPPDPAPPPIR